MKLLTVVVPVYNTEKYIKRCLDSLDNKEVNEKLEVLIVSDGSKDNAINIAREYEKRLPDTFKIIEKENGGHGSTINKGLELATGKYFRVLDSDDWVDSVDFVEFVKKLEKTNSDLVITDYCKEYVYEGKSEKIIYNNLEKDIEFKFDEFDLNDLNGEYFVMATSTYKTEVLRNSNLKLMEKTFYVDMQYNAIPITKVNTFIYYDLDIYRYFIGRKDQSVNTASFVKNQVNHDKVIKSLIDFYNDNEKILTVNRKKYIQIIIKYMLFTHYSIYCIYYNSNKEAYRLVKSFDNYLLKSNKELYDLINVSYIKIYRILKFLPVLFLFNKIKVVLVKMFKSRRG